MPSPTLPPPPKDSALSVEGGVAAPVWARWLQQLRDAVVGGSLPYAFCNTATAQTLANGAATIVNFGNVVSDTDGAVTTGSGWRFTVPEGKGGRYFICAGVSVATAAAAGEAIVALRKNGSELLRGTRTPSTASTSVVDGLVSAALDLAAGDYIDVTLYQSTGSSRALEAVSASNWISIAATRA